MQVNDDVPEPDTRHTLDDEADPADALPAFEYRIVANADQSKLQHVPGARPKNASVRAVRRNEYPFWCIVYPKGLMVEPEKRSRIGVRSHEWTENDRSACRTRCAASAAILPKTETKMKRVVMTVVAVLMGTAAAQAVSRARLRPWKDGQS